MTRRIAAAASTIILVIALAGCAQASPYPTETAATLQSQVLAVSTAAAGSDFASAMTRLDELEVGLNDALARGAVTQERFDSIRSAIDLVRTDLETALQKDDKPGKKNEKDKNG